jgi:MinD superfamily P-loop ATPase
VYEQARIGGEKALKVAVASGKGGTGKTTIATNLAVTLAGLDNRVELLDCDVEEPNCHIFLNPLIESSAPAFVSIPEVVQEKCTGCGVCGEICEYSAVVVVKGKVLLFPELCHGCGACSFLCPENAIRETKREIGVIERGKSFDIDIVQGFLNIGELMSPAVIHGVKETASNPGIVIFDAPPGTSCPVIEAVKDAQFVLLVTEPTPFGLNDLELAVGMVKELGLPFAVAINRSDIGTDDVKKYCRKENIKIVLEMPDDRRIAEAYSRGQMIVHALPEYKTLFKACWGRIQALYSSLTDESSLRELVK